jgi:cold shock CspA family protein
MIPKALGALLEKKGEDLIVHFADTQGSGFKSLVDPQQVQSEVVNSPKGPRAADVVKLWANA